MKTISLSQGKRTIVDDEICEALKQKKDFTGQINVEIHFKEGIVKDVYVTNRSKIAT